jgi:hypothetical protein
MSNQKQQEPKEQQQQIEKYLGLRLKGSNAYTYIYQQIKLALDTSKPIMIGKIGANELLLIYCHHLNAKGKMRGFPPDVITEIENTAGLYPIDNETINSFIQIYLESLRGIDIFASWNDRFIEFEKALYSNYIKPSKGLSGIVELTALESFYTTDRTQWWQTLFAGKCILVISPFTDSIRKQLEPEKRNMVWSGKWEGFWPDSIEFKYIKFEHPYSLLSKEEQVKIETSKCFLDKLKRFEKEIDLVCDFDIAVIGAGCYSLPLCAYVKNQKKRCSFHLGGGLQMMFGVYGSRWNISNGVFKEYVNDAWIRPSGNEIPTGFKKQEAGAYF